MSKKALLDSVSEAGRITVMHEEDGVHRVESRQDLTNVLKAVDYVRDLEPGKDFRHAAYIPDVVLNQAFTEGWFNDKARWKAWANDPANACFRTWPGRI